MPFWQGSSLPTSGSISLNQIHVESGGSSGTTINFNNRRIRNLTGFKKSSSGAKSFSQCRGAYADGFPANTNNCEVKDDVVSGGYGVSSQRTYYQGRPYIDAGSVSIGANTSSVIRYYAASDWEDEGEGDYDWSAAVVAVAPGYGGGASFSHNASLGDISGTNGLCRCVWIGDGSEGAAGSIENEGVDLKFRLTSLYPWGITVD